MSATHQPLTIRQKIEFEKWINKIYLEEIKSVSVGFVDYQPYKSVAEMQEDYGQGKLKISRFGSKSSLINSQANLKWRAIHDCHHCKSGYDFSFQGELNIWFYVCKEYNLPKWMEGLIFSDVVFQAATTVHNRYFSEEQKNVMSYV